MKFVFLLTCLFTVQTAFAQDFKFGKVSKAELLETENVLERNTNAAILYRNQNIKFVYIEDLGFIQENHVFERIKIYNKKGFEFATKKIRLYTGEGYSEDLLRNLKAYTYTLEKNKIVETKLEKTDIFEEKISRDWKTVHFKMPNVKENAILEIRYVIQSELLSINDIPFQKEIPINKLDVKVSTPEFYNYTTIVNPKAIYTPKIVQSSEPAKNTIMRKKHHNARSGNLTSTIQDSVVNYSYNILNSNLENIPSLSNEDYVDNINNYQAKLIMELKSIQLPDTPFKNVSTTWGEVTKTIYESSYFRDQLIESDYFKNDLSQATAGITDPVEQINSVFDFVKTKVKWNGLEGYNTDLGVKQAYQQGVGNVADINLILISMLREAGLDANPVLISTKNNGVPLFPSLSSFNYVICAVNSAQGILLLDASEPFTSVNVLPVKVLNWQGRIIQKDGSSDWINLLVKEVSKEIVSLNMTLNPDLSATGIVRSQFTDYSALTFRNRFKSASQEDLIKEVESKNVNLQVSNLDLEVKDKSIKPVLLTYQYQLDHAVEEIKGNYYFSPLLFLKLNETPFKLETRKYPLDLNFPTSRKYVVNIMLPEGFEVESLPANEKLQYNDTEGEFTYLIKENGSTLQLVITLDLNNSLILPADYKQFKQFFELVVKKQAETIVLKKV
ncbi:DUF3858 domain-containing protein [Bizionia arctica]|uniref:DUF3857 domain-containing protein n=1 Tax=Bizionia arctica TaxID=1495645 RepID=A0A917LJR0_9FLAO|nr:DUF3858 domain-containing protein [Bizionia arctica]GGG32769.1 hypothetical protein GCM10010976_00710 [Bizionia arctica]